MKKTIKLISIILAIVMCLTALTIVIHSMLTVGPGLEVFENNKIAPGLYETGSNYTVLLTSWDDLIADEIIHNDNGVLYTNIDWDAERNYSSDALAGDLMLPQDGSITALGDCINSYDEEADIKTETSNMTFAMCTELTGVAIPENITEISVGTFHHCYNLTNIIVADGNKNYCSVDGVLYTKDMCRLVIYPAGKPDTSFTIPDSVTTIGERAFCYCDNLTNITIPNSVTAIAAETFYGCSNLTSATIPDSVTVIGEWTFGHCYSLTNIDIPDSITTIGECAFSVCTNLTSVTIPDSVTAIGENVFFFCDSLANIIVADGNKNYCSVDGVLYTKDICKLVVYPEGKTDTSFTIPDSVTTIGGWAFSSCNNLTNITIPNDVIAIDARAFFGCDHLADICYTGTEDQWNAITFGDSWDFETGSSTTNGAYTISCNYVDN